MANVISQCMPVNGATTSSFSHTVLPPYSILCGGYRRADHKSDPDLDPFRSESEYRFGKCYLSYRACMYLCSWRIR
jgi:hypothetical protein